MKRSSVAKGNKSYILVSLRELMTKHHYFYQSKSFLGCFRQQNDNEKTLLFPCLGSISVGLSTPEF